MFMDRFGRQWSGPHPLDRGNIWTHAPLKSGVLQIFPGDGDAAPLYVAGTVGSTIQQQLLGVVIRLDTARAASKAPDRSLAFACIECDDVAAQRIVSAAQRWSPTEVRQLDRVLDLPAQTTAKASGAAGARRA